MIPATPTTVKALNRLLQQGEGRTLEFKRSTGELREAMQTLCAFLNGDGGLVLFGVRPDGRAEGQQVSDKTLRDVAQALDGFEPPVNIPLERLTIEKDRCVLILRATTDVDSVPYQYESRAYERVGSTTRKMSQEKYEALLLKRGHAKRRWENLPAEGVTLKDLDRKEILRTRDLAVQQNRISPEIGRDVGEILDRLGLRIDGVLTQAAQVLYGKRLFPDLPQCQLKLGRFRGTAVTGPIVDNRQEHMHAFAMVREGMAFLERTLPLGARFPEGQIFREDRFPIPLPALREILLNAVMHRDYGDAGGHVAVAVFDDRVEIRSCGRLPAGVTLKQLSGSYLSRRRNPLIAETFHRTGAVEIWGRGTNRVIDECLRHGIDVPTFTEMQGFLIVTFKAPIADAALDDSQRTAQVTAQVTMQVRAMLEAAVTPRTREELQLAAGIKNREHFRKKHLMPLLEVGWLERTIPDKPNSRLQKYRMTAAGRAALETR
jgi:ATP-dependent DNA helicase RecG